MQIEELLKIIARLEAEIEVLRRENAELKAENAELKAENAELKRRLNQNSTNSSRPPSLDGFINRPKPKSLRERSGKSSGGQKGRLGRTLLQVKDPDMVVVHGVSECTNCHASLKSVEADFVDKRQVFEIPEPKIDVIEHHREKKLCPSCGHLSAAVFPSGVEQHVQYGPRAKALMSAYRNFLKTCLVLLLARVLCSIAPGLHIKTLMHSKHRPRSS